MGICAGILDLGLFDLCIMTASGPASSPIEPA
jgi:hypothetical protein